MSNWDSSDILGGFIILSLVGVLLSVIYLAYTDSQIKAECRKNAIAANYPASEIRVICGGS